MVGTVRVHLLKDAFEIAQSVLLFAFGECRLRAVVRLIRWTLVRLHVLRVELLVDECQRAQIARMEFDELVDSVLVILAQSLFDDVGQRLLDGAGLLIRLVHDNHLLLRHRLELLVRLHVSVELIAFGELPTADPALPAVRRIRVDLCVNLSGFACLEAL